jgi:hypothetical protein
MEATKLAKFQETAVINCLQGLSIPLGQLLLDGTVWKETWERA